MDKPKWWPENPYPKDIFPMDDDEYVKAIPDPVLRTAVSGCVARWAWDVASKTIFKAYCEELQELEDL